MNKKKSIIAVTLITIAIILAITTFIIIYTTIDPSDKIYFPKCMFKMLTGYNCPGCGSQRAFHHLFNGEFTAAFIQNPVMWIVLTYISIYLILKYITDMQNGFKKIYTFLDSYKTKLVIMALIIVWWVIRNVLGI